MMQGKSLFALFHERGLSYEAVAQHLAIPVGRVEKWILWQSVPTPAECIQLAELLAVDLPTIYLSLFTP